MEKPTGVIQKIIESLQQINALDVYSPIEKDIILHNLRAAYMIFLNIPVNAESEEDRVERLFEVGGTRCEVGGVRCEVEGTRCEVEGTRCEVGEEEKGEEETIEEKIEIETQEIEHVTEEEPEIEQQVEIFSEEIIEEEIIEEETIEEETTEFVDMVDIVEEETTEEELVEEEFVEEEVIEAEPIKEEVIEEQIIVEEIIEEKIIIEPSNAPVVTSAPQQQPLHDDLLEFIPDARPQPTLLFEETTLFKSEKKSLNDLLIEKKEDQSLGTKFQQSYIPDLTKAIAINEKFTFIRELFRNSGMDFSNAVQKLNDCENIDVAFNLMEELKHQYLWDTTSSTYLSLCDLVRRRFL